MSDALIPKEQLTAYQRWELPIFNMAQASGSLPADTVLTVAQLEQIQSQAHEEGYRAGIQQARDEAQRMAGLMNALDNELQQADQNIAQDLLDLALEIARQVLQQALKVKRDLLLGIVREAISELPHFNQHAHLVMHPADAELVRDSMGEQLSHINWKILEDPQMERGGCRVETTHSQIDATLATRWTRVVSSIGKDDSWLES